MDHGAAEPAEVLLPGVALDRDARRASSIEVDPATLAAVEARLEGARAAIGGHYGLPLGRREGPGFLRYGPGGFYRPHRDRAVDGAWPDAARRRISLIVFLNSSRAGSTGGEFNGGELAIFSEPSAEGATTDVIRIAPRQGTLVAFHASALHEVRPVTGGLRDVIVDWFY